MFPNLQSKLDSAFKRLRGKATVSKQDIEETLKEVRMALLSADVNFKVTKDFCDRVSVAALGESVMKSLSPSQQIIKIVHDELINTMGSGATELNIKVAPPFVLLLVGLQGAGKTTAAAKLALLLRKEYKKKALLVPADIYRPAAIEQLKILGKQLQVPVFDTDPTMNPVEIATRAREMAINQALDAVIIDTVWSSG